MKELNLFEINNVAGAGITDFPSYISAAMDYIHPNNLTPAQQVGVGLAGITGCALALGAKAFLMSLSVGALTSIAASAAVNYYNSSYDSSAINN